MENYYETLGVSETASTDEIKKAYKKLARENHPDMANGDNSKMQKINEAYDTLKDPNKKQEYDTIRKYGGFGHGNPHSGHRSSGHHYYDFDFGNFSSNGSSMHEDHIQEILRQMMGGGFNDGFRGGPHFGQGFGRSPFEGRRPVNRDINLNYDISLEEAYKGKKVRSNIKLDDNTTKELVFEIPAGINNGDRIRLKGSGYNENPRVKPGDVFVHIKIKPHAIFERKGQNLHSRIRIDALDAMIGTNVQFKTIDGNQLNIRVPPGTQQGETLRCRGKGFKVRDMNVYGDLFLEVNIVVPRSLTPEEESLVRQIQNLREKS